MKKILENAIVNIDENYFDNKFLFQVPTNLRFKGEVDMSELLEKHKNVDLDYKKDYKLWSQVYSNKDEIKVFTEIFDNAIANNKRVHISNISLLEEIDMVKKLYSDLGYFDKELNRFEIDFVNAPVTIGVNIRNIIYSFKDYKFMREKVLFVPPPREPRHQKAIKSAINSWIISTIWLNSWAQEREFLLEIIREEKTSLIRLARAIYFNFWHRWFSLESSELELTV